MAKEICISSTPHETRLAILEDDQLAEIYYERENEYTLAGSVYKGRVTRVLPGMQSAFVDIGLERDAFLYVTDFLEMEDQEDTDEVERAASQGDTQRALQAPPQARQNRPDGQGREGQPREGQAREGQGRGDGRDRRPDRGSERGSESGARRGEGRAAEPEFQPVTSFAIEPIEGGYELPAPEAEAGAPQEGDEQSARRWRGRRRRRGGGRGRDEQGGPEAGSAPDESGEPEEMEAEPLEFSASAVAPVTEASPAPWSTPSIASSPRASAAPAPFVLPGESLSKYGAPVPSTPAPSRLVLTELPPDLTPAPPERTSAKPSTLVEHEIVWDGRGLLPGESLARHRKTDRESVETVDAEPSGVFAPHSSPAETAEAAPASGQGSWAFEFSEVASGRAEEHAANAEELTSHEAVAHEAFTHESLYEPGVPAEVAEAADAGAVEHPGDVQEEMEEILPPSFLHGTSSGESEEVIEAAEAGAIESPGEIAENPLPHPVEEGAGGESAEEIHDASASHNVDPLPPSSFRLKDLFIGRKRSEESEPEPVAPPTAAAPAPVAAVSAYAPGDGLVEEEIIEEEEYEFAPMKAHHDEHDLEEIEEETLQQQIRSGALGEMLQEAQFDHRVEVEEEEDEEEDEAAPVTPGRAASAPGGGRDRGGERSGERGRGRRGRGGPGDGRGEGRSEGRGDGRRGPSRRSAQTSDLPIISDLLKPGQEVLVQIAKEPIAKKGARITSHIALPGRFLVFMPTVSHVGVSRKIASDEERQRLKRILVSEKGDATGGFIVRTAAEGATEDELRADLRFLINLWADIKQRADSSKPPALIYHDLSLIERILRDQISDNFSHIWVDSEADYERIVRFLNRFSPELVRRVKLYTKEIPLFEHFGIQEEISKALRSKVWLKSGGSIVINQTEALVAIDINTGKYVGKTARLEDTILKTNLDAIPEIVRQIRLRDLGGIIVIDFIDMDERKNRTRVMAALEEALKQDRAPTKVLQFNDFGLVAITRKRVKQSLERTLSVPCPVCQATGMVKSPATVCNEIYIEVRKMRRHFDQTEVLLRVNPETAKVLKSNNARWLTQLEELAGKNVLVKSDATLHPEQFDIQG